MRRVYNVLFLCTGNSARSIMAEAITRSMLPAGAPIEVFSAGTAPKGVHPETEAVLREAGVETAGLRSKGLGDVPFGSADVVVTLCGEARDACPAPPAGARQIHWALRDPSAATGGAAEVRETNPRSGLSAQM